MSIITFDLRPNIFAENSQNNTSLLLPLSSPLPLWFFSLPVAYTDEAHCQEYHREYEHHYDFTR